MGLVLAVACPAFAQGPSLNVRTSQEPVLEPNDGQDGEGEAAAGETGDADQLRRPLDIKLGGREKTASNKILINVVMDASGSMAYRDIVDPVSGEKLERGLIVKKALSAYFNALDEKTTSAGLLLFAHRFFHARARKEADSSDVDDDAGGEADSGSGLPSLSVSQSTTLDSSDDYEFWVRPSALGEKYLKMLGRKDLLERLDEDDREALPDEKIRVSNPSFDVEQAIEILNANPGQKKELSGKVEEVQFETGAPTPLHQGVLEAVKRLKAVESDAEIRDVVVVTDEFNHLADGSLQYQDVRLSQIRAELEGSPVRIHWVLFGPEFRPEEGMTELSSYYKREQLKQMKLLAEDFDGTLRIAQTPKELALALVPLINPKKKPPLGVIEGQLVREGRPVPGRSEFTVKLSGADAEPKVTKDGKFKFENIEMGKDYTIEVKGRVRNSTYSTTKEKVQASLPDDAKPVEVDLVKKEE